MRDEHWAKRFLVLLAAIESIQNHRYTVSLRELEKACGRSRQTISKWLAMAEELGYVNLHHGQPRAIELLAKGRQLIRQWAEVNGLGEWKQIRRELGIKEMSEI